MSAALLLPYSCQQADAMASACPGKLLLSSEPMSLLHVRLPLVRRNGVLCWLWGIVVALGAYPDPDDIVTPSAKEEAG